MKAIKQFALTLIAAIVVVIGAEVAVVKAMGKEGLRELPFVGELFTVAESPDAFEEPKDKRVDEIDNILATLKERAAKQAEQDDELEQLRRLKEDIDASEQHVLELFNRIRQLFPIIDEARQETLLVLAKKYVKMSPEGAAQILGGMKDEECAELLLVMKDRSSAAVLEAFATMGTSAIEQDANRKRATSIGQLMRKTLLLSNEEAALFSPSSAAGGP